MSYALQTLPFPTHALEPYISRAAVEFHYRNHHAGYIKRTSELVDEFDMPLLPLDELVTLAASLGHQSLFNCAAQAWNHDFYWNSLRPGGGGAATGTIATLIDADFGSYPKFAKQIAAAAMAQFGSGWVWLVLNGGHLEILSTSNADTPIVTGKVPLLNIDVWEHAYYLDYQYRRAAYVTDVIDRLFNWEFANRNLESIVRPRPAKGLAGTHPEPLPVSHAY